ncbi:hypothetical protein D1632_07500 [Chryseobacterium nematophagum]|uniref:DUF4347 domain-containing protein n=1 Tax=Chryseobacterium nematophagum TaxID=2305228 RepID=A0A3M7LA88_9FLAO|nr:hypothetical protein [Chryseobacterium nematophagum]RMZ59477.1 hypothetical protein D1632_07500 [Chryseobacterium nematophagum]
MGKQLKKATSVFSIKKVTIKGNEKKFENKVLNNDIGKEYIIVIAPQKFQHNFPWFSENGKGTLKNIRNYKRNDAGENGKFMFIHQGIRRVKLNQEFNFNWTILMYTFGYTENQITKTKEAFQRFAPECNFVKIASYQEATNYINTKNKDKATDDKKLREKCLVERVFIYCHGFVGKLAMGLTNRSSGDEKLDWDEKVASKLHKNAFSNSAKLYSFSCKTGLGNLEIEEENNIKKQVYEGEEYSGYSSPTTMIPTSHPVYKTITLPLLGEKSLAQQLANATGAMVHAYCSRSDYEDTLNTSDELDFMEYYEAGDGKKPKRTNNNYKYLLNKKNRKPEDVKRYDTLQKIDKKRILIDGGRFDFDGARHPVKGGTTPVGTPNDMKTYIKK